MKTIFWLIVIMLIVYLGYATIPLYYKGIFGIRGVCKNNVELYHKYGMQFVVNRINEGLDNLGIPKKKRDFSVNVMEDKVVVEIGYVDQINLLDRYRKKVEFYYECEGVLKSVYN